MKISERFYSVGVSNPTLRVFDIIMATGYGTTYNSYLIMGDNKKVVIDGSHDGFEENWKHNIEEITPMDSIDYMVINHTEPDHSGCVAYMIDHNPNITIYGTTAALKNLEAISQRSFEKVVVKDGDSIDLGGITLQFLVAPNVHWPDTMMTWCPETKYLFSCDFLGAHYAEPTGFLDTAYKPELYDIEFQNYYGAIMSPFAPFVQKALKRIEDLEIELVAPSHGPMLRGDDISRAIERYDEWSRPQEKDKKSVSILYVSAYGYTRQMCHYLADSLEKAGLDVYIADIIKVTPDDISANLNADAFVFGSPTINRAALKPVWDTISSLDAINAKGKLYATIGCFGWSGEACGQLNDRLNGLKMKQVAESVKSRFAPTEATWKELDDLSAALVAALA